MTLLTETAHTRWVCWPMSCEVQELRFHCIGSGAYWVYSKHITNGILDWKWGIALEVGHYIAVSLHWQWGITLQFHCIGSGALHCSFIALKVGHIRFMQKHY